MNEKLKEKIKKIDFCKFSGIVSDSRKVRPGFVFCAYPGENGDGRNYITQACEQGAAFIFYEKYHAKTLPLPGVASCAVENLRNHLSDIAGLFYAQPSDNVSVLGVTGTNGKTSITYLYAQLLTALGYHAGLIGTNGVGCYGRLEKTINTTPGAIELQQQLYDFVQAGVSDVALEVSSHSLVQQRLAAIKMDTAIYTNLTQDHLDYHGSMVEYAAAKAKLIQQLGLKTVIINDDDAYCRSLQDQIPTSLQVLRYGFNATADIRVVNPCYSLSGVEGEIITPWGRGKLQSPLLGDFNLYNLLAVVAALGVKGVALDKILFLLKTATAPLGRLQGVNYKKSRVIVDYAHTPDALKKVLLILKKLTTGRLWCIVGCGGDRDREKRPLMGKIASTLADRLILTSDNPRFEEPVKIIEEIALGVQRQCDVIINREQAITQTLQLLAPEDVLLIAGKGHEDYQEIQGERYYFSDIDIIKRALEGNYEDITTVSECD